MDTLKFNRKSRFITLFKMMLIIFIGELVVMIGLGFVETHNYLFESFLDAFMLSLLCAPIFHHFFIEKLIHKNEQLIIDLEREVEGLNIAALLSETDSKGIITKVNQQFCDVSGYSENELVGTTHRLVNSKHHTKEFWDDFWCTIQSGKVWNGDVCNLAKNGGLYWVNATVFPKKDFDGNITGFSAVRVNITEQYLVKQELERAIDLSNDLIKSKSLFLANMSHEIRTPMNGVLGMAQLLSDTKVDDEQKSMVKTIQSCADSMLTIINDILDFSKIDSNKLELEIRRFEISELVGELVYLFSASALQKNITIKQSISQRVPKCFTGDSNRIRQILSNFLSNAIKFSNKDAQVIVNLDGEKAPHSARNMFNLIFTVKDFGIGIKKEDQKKLFTAFTQADISVTREFGGTGLGLAICAKLTEMMNGEIELESEYGQGTTMTFKLQLPFETDEESSVLDMKHINNTKDCETKLLSESYPQQILIAEDNLVNQRVAKLMIKKLGYDVDIVNNGLEALKACENKIYTIIFMDMMMPEMDGITATKEIIKNYGAAAPVIIAMTANVFEKETCLKSGMSDFIAKPITKAELKRVIVSINNPDK